MKISPIYNKGNSAQQNFKGWETHSSPITRSCSSDPTNDYSRSEEEIIGYEDIREWNPEYNDYFNKERIKKDLDNYGKDPKWDELIFKSAKSRIKEINKYKDAPRPLFGFFGSIFSSKYNGIVQQYMSNVLEEKLKNIVE